jgi:hypothetical protein
MRVKKVWETARNKRVWDAVNKIRAYPKKSKILTEEQVKKVMLDCTEVNTSCPESVQKYGERCEMVGELYYGYKKYMKLVGKRDAKLHEDRINLHCQVEQYTTEAIERLISYKDEYIG